MHETSKRLSQTLRDVYESDWNGAEDLPVVTEVSSWPRSWSSSLSGSSCEANKSRKFDHIWQLQRNRNPTNTEVLFFFYRGGWITVISCLSFSHFKINLPEMLQAGQSETRLICFCRWEKGTTEPWTGFSCDTKWKWKLLNNDSCYLVSVLSGLDNISFLKYYIYKHSTAIGDFL